MKYEIKKILKKCLLGQERQNILFGNTICIIKRSFHFKKKFAKDNFSYPFPPPPPPKKKK